MGLLSRQDPAVLGAVIISTLTVVALSCLMPARWAAAVDPVEVLQVDE